MLMPLRRGMIALVALVGLAACDGVAPLGGSPDLGATTLDRGPGGALSVTAPPGYCIDRRSLRDTPLGGFVVMARCDTLGVGSLFGNRRLALITVTTAAMEPDAPAPTLAALKASVAPARVIEARRVGKVPMVRLAEEPGPVQGLTPEHWRAVLALNGQLVALALYMPDAPPASEAADLLAEVAARIRAEAPPAAAAPAPARKAQAGKAPRAAELRPRARPDSSSGSRSGAPVEGQGTKAAATKAPAGKSPFRAIAGLFQ
ncbi:hypothetical protein [Pseudodonghicola flavimaris]|uniref:Uncharacterized protein n=1 Tax=Pseudodonghicola flavimaris TaxID=3050036 RepID=A0ABT7EZ80_9RHOB|nr:hypothetical protein [Pseudodonghicola flavimaris]MDK3017655.1 hypothetical protein [Pseudodonghicola flavimaris]